MKKENPAIITLMILVKCGFFFLARPYKDKSALFSQSSLDHMTAGKRMKAIADSD